MASTPIYNLPYPSLGDAPNVPQWIQDLAEETETEIARVDAAAAALLPASQSMNAATNGNVTSLTFTTSRSAGGTVGVAFTAPASGKVSVAFSAGLRNTGANATLVGVRVGTGSTLGAGTELLSASDDRALMNVGTDERQFGRTLQATGFTPGASLNAVIQYRVTVITGVVGRLEIVVTPQFA